MKEWRVRVTIEARVDWKDPPATEGERIARKYADLMARAKAKEFERELESILESDFGVNKQ